MKKKIGFLCVVGLMLAGCGNAKLQNGQDAVVSFKNNEMISVDDLYTKMKNNFALNTLITMVDTKVLETEFADYKETAESYAENNLKASMENYGGEEEFLKLLQANGYATIDAYQQYVYLSYMQSHAVEEYSKLQVSDKDIEKYYKDKAKGDVEISHILITSDVTSSMTEEEKTKAKEEAKSKAESIIKEINKSKDKVEKFKEYVKSDSKDDATKDKDGALGKITYGDLAATYDELLDAAYKIKDNEVYSKVVTTELGYHIILKTKTHEKESLDNLKDEIREILSKDLLANDKLISINALKYYREQNGVKIEDSELAKQYERYLQNVVAQANKK